MLKETMPVIHCSAGIGRSGTLAAVMGAWNKIQNHQVSDNLVFDVVSALRAERHGAVQTPSQYKTIYAALKNMSEWADNETFQQPAPLIVPLEASTLKPSKVSADEPVKESNNNTTLLPKIQIVSQPLITDDHETPFQKMSKAINIEQMWEADKELEVSEADQFYLQIGLIINTDPKKNSDSEYLMRAGMRAFYQKVIPLDQCKMALKKMK